MYLLSQALYSRTGCFFSREPSHLRGGVFVGTLGFGSRLNISSKSPESGHIGDTNMGGDFAAELVKAGFGHLVITGKSKRPVYLHVHNGRIEIRNAAAPERPRHG